VAELSSTTIDCSTSVFGSLYPASDLYLTTATTIDPQTVTACVARPADCPYNNSVTTIIVPSGAGEDTVCGNDIALLILGDPISLPQYVVPTINPPMTSSQYETTVTAIGYGVTTPTDTSGSTAGTRRIKENVALQCIPDDPNPSESALNCYTQNTQPPPQSFLTASEFMSGDSTCEGDSGSGAFEQSNFNAGKWVAFGVLSRGGTNGTPGTTCIQPIYSRFDAWGSMLASAATQAASQGGYSVPAWAMNLDAGTGQSPSSEAGSSGNSSGGTSSSGGSSGAGGSSGGAIDGTPCHERRRVCQRLRGWRMLGRVRLPERLLLPGDHGRVARGVFFSPRGRGVFRHGGSRSHAVQPGLPGWDRPGGRGVEAATGP
jgi:hypothetical protein